jgi:hypothetical protein
MEMFSEVKEMIGNGYACMLVWVAKKLDKTVKGYDPQWEARGGGI